MQMRMEALHARVRVTHVGCGTHVVDPLFELPPTPLAALGVVCRVGRGARVCTWGGEQSIMRWRGVRVVV